MVDQAELIEFLPSSNHHCIGHTFEDRSLLNCRISTIDYIINSKQKFINSHSLSRQLQLVSGRKECNRDGKVDAGAWWGGVASSLKYVLDRNNYNILLVWATMSSPFLPPSGPSGSRGWRGVDASSSINSPASNFN